MCLTSGQRPRTDVLQLAAKKKFEGPENQATERLGQRLRIHAFGKKICGAGMKRCAGIVEAHKHQQKPEGQMFQQKHHVRSRVHGKLSWYSRVVQDTPAAVGVS